MAKLFKKTIEHCYECPMHKVVGDPDPFDSFCDDDEAAVCLASKTQPKRNEHGNYMSGEPMLTVAARPYETKKDLEHIPNWCPLEDA